MKTHGMYIDLGAFDGDSIKDFIKNHDESWVIYGFEPATCHKAALQHIEQEHKNVVIVYAAASNKDGETLFTERPPDKPYGSMTNPDKLWWGEGKVYKVRTLDFSQWFKNVYKSYDRVNISPVIIKLDVEGAEFDILEKMIEDGTWRYVDEFWLEWHDGKMGDKSPEYAKRKEKILETIEDKVIPWD